VASAYYVPVEYHVVHPIFIQHRSIEEAPTTTSTTTEKAKEETKVETPKNYDFKYEVHDEKTGDIKRQFETVSNGQTKGQYSLIDSDGYRRLVEYTADSQNGFEAKVTREKTHFRIPEQQTRKAEEKKEEIEKPIVEWISEDESAKPYQYRYEVHDSHTGDIKRQQETASKEGVKGQYSLIDSDGFRRVVEYTADAKNGFQANVRREPTHYRIPEQKQDEKKEEEKKEESETPKSYIRWW
jgi:hypothetical protein